MSCISCACIVEIMCSRHPTSSICLNSTTPPVSQPYVKFEALIGTDTWLSNMDVVKWNYSSQRFWCRDFLLRFVVERETGRPYWALFSGNTKFCKSTRPQEICSSMKVRTMSMERAYSDRNGSTVKEETVTDNVQCEKGDAICCWVLRPFRTQITELCLKAVHYPLPHH